MVPYLLMDKLAQVRLTQLKVVPEDTRTEDWLQGKHC